MNKSLIKNYYSLTKPGIIYGNGITVIGGFLLASKGMVDIGLLFFTLIGISLVIASGCVLNNYIDRDIDAKMERTKKRALVLKLVPEFHALIYAILLGFLGIKILVLFTNILTVLIALFGFFFYVVVYSLFAKRHNSYGTLIGSISGAVPPVVGYVAVSGTLDAGAIILFLILTLWQMPHSYAIAIYRLKDYTNAHIPVLPVSSGIQTTKVHMLLYIILFLFASLLLTIYGYTGTYYAVIMAVVSLLWLLMGVLGFSAKDEHKWARNMFTYSILVICVFSIVISLSGIFA